MEKDKDFIVKIIKTNPEVLLLYPDILKDERGFESLSLFK